MLLVVWEVLELAFIFNLNLNLKEYVIKLI